MYYFQVDFDKITEEAMSCFLFERSSLCLKFNKDKADCWITVTNAVGRV